MEPHSLVHHTFASLFYDTVCGFEVILEELNQQIIYTHDTQQALPWVSVR